MGSFNTTCFATQQTISTTNPCYILPISQNSGYNGVKLTRNGKPAIGSSVASSTCYTDAFWKPFGGFIKATYDDYGQVKIDFTDADTKKKVIALFKELSRGVFTTLEEDNKSHDVSFNISECEEKPIDEAWDYLWTAAVHELRVFLTPYQDNYPRQFTFAIISEQAYDYLLETVESVKGWGGSSHYRDDIIDSFKSALDLRMLDFDTPDKCDGVYAKGGERYDSMRSNVAMQIIRTALEGDSNVRTPVYLLENMYDFSDDLIVSGNVSDVNRFKLKKLMEFSYIMSGLNDLNIKISPMVYASQDYNNSVGEAYAKMIKTVSGQISRQQKRDLL